VPVGAPWHIHHVDIPFARRGAANTRRVFSCTAAGLIDWWKTESRSRVPLCKRRTQEPNNLGVQRTKFAPRLSRERLMQALGNPTVEVYNDLLLLPDMHWMRSSFDQFGAPIRA
jgi:hypothetical protein